MKDVILTNIYDALFGQPLEAIARRLGLPLDADEKAVRAALGIPARAAIDEYVAHMEMWQARQRGYPGYVATQLQAQHVARVVAGRYEMTGYKLGPEFARAALLY